MNLLPIPLSASAWMLSEASMERIGWVLVHSLWQFLLVAILAQVVLRLLKRSSASLRYAIMVFTMAACVVLPVATWFRLPTASVAVAADVRNDAIAPLSTESMPSPFRSSDEVANVSDDQGAIAELPAISNQPSIESSHAVTETSDWWMNAVDNLRPWLTSIVTVWILGVMICAMRPLLSWIAIRRWRRVGTSPVGKEATELMLRLMERLRVGRTVEILQSTLVHVPLVVGYVRPMILLPASLLTNLPTSQLEAIIAHELAHVRRHDYLVNVLQTIIETLFFYHPAIWWLSHRIRIERENCCDDMVVQTLGNRVEYGRALVAIAQLRAESHVLALGVSDGSMLARIRRIAGQSGNRNNSSSWSLMSVLASSLPVVVIIGLIGWHSIAATPAQTANEPVADAPILDRDFRDEVSLKLARKDAHQGKWYFVDLDQSTLKAPPFDVEIDATRFPYFVTKPGEEELSDWLKRDGVDLILRSSIYRPDPKGPIEKNEIQVRSVRTLLKEFPRGFEKENSDSPTSKQTADEDVLDAFGAKDDAVHVVGFIPNTITIDIRPDSPLCRSFRTASNLLGVFQLEQPNSSDDELKLRIAYAANTDRPLDDLRFGPDDFVSGIESLENPVVRKSSEAPFVAKFPNDVRVEFVGLSRGVGDIKTADKWWRPDGSPLEQAPEHRGVSGTLKEGEVESDDPFVRTVIHVHGIGDNNAVTSTSAMQIAESLKDESGGQYVADHGYIDAPGRSRTFEVGVATEALSPKRWLDRAGKRIESKGESAKDPIVEDITIERIGPESWGKGSTSKGGMTDPVRPGDQKMGSVSESTQVTVRFPLAWRTVDLRLFAIDKSGSSHVADFTVTLDPNDENADYKRLAKVIPVDYSEVDHFEYQFRVYRHWAIFENVSLWKAIQTEVVMKSETIPKTSVSLLSSTANSSEPQPVVANRGTLRGRFVFDGMAPTPNDYFGSQGAIDWTRPQQPGPDGRISGVEGLYREFLAKGVRPETKAQNLVVGNDLGVANIYVWASSKNIPWEAPAEGLAPVNVEFRDGQLTSRCIKVVAGQQLQLVNRDPVDHSLAADFMKARNSSFNSLLKAQSKYELKLSFPVAEPFPTRLDLGRARWASGVLFVHSNPYVAITQSDGSFEIENLPIGEWEFQVWHETAGYLLPNKGVFKHTIVEGENNLGAKLLKPEAFGIRDAAKAGPVKPENREQIGTVQGKPVYRDEIVNGNLLELFTKPIWTKYKAEHRESIEPTEKELESARSYFSQQHRARLDKEGGESKLREKLKAIEDKLSDSKLSEEEANKLEIEHSGIRARLRPFDPGFANFILDNWKLQKHLYENFGGGRILWQQAGQEAFDAMRTWLELQEKNGEFRITDPKVRVQFYQYWNQDHGPFLTSDEQRIREEFLQPPWGRMN